MKTWLKTPINLRSYAQFVSHTSITSFLAISNMVITPSMMMMIIPSTVLIKTTISITLNHIVIIIPPPMVHRPRHRAWYLATGVLDEISIRRVQLLLEPDDLPLEHWYRPHAPINRVFEPRLSLIGEGIDSVLSLVREDLIEELAHVASPEYLVDIGELLGLLGREVGRKDAIRQALSPQELASSARRARVTRWWSHIQQSPQTLQQKTKLLESSLCVEIPIEVIPWVMNKPVRVCELIIIWGCLCLVIVYELTCWKQTKVVSNSSCAYLNYKRLFVGNIST